jgi:hypothetical protein
MGEGHEMAIRPRQGKKMKKMKKMKKKTDSKGPHPIQPLKNFNCHLMV